MTTEFMRPGKVSILFDGQFGSTGKGLIAGYLAEKNTFDIAAITASPNAGHTFWWGGKFHVVHHLPVSGVVNPNTVIYLTANSVIDLKGFYEELAEFEIDPKRVLIHPRAAVVSQVHIDRERASGSSTEALGSTQTGSGAALADKIMRVPGATAGEHEDLHDLCAIGPVWKMLDKDMSVFLEIPQGYSLGINSGRAYPHCTSKEISVSQALSDLGVHPSYLGKVMMTARTYPIRVGHIMKDGEIIGNSGPPYYDQTELKWDELGLQPELTTVTKRPRRIFTWSDHGFRRAYEQNRPDFVFLNFINYLQSFDELKNLLHRVSAVRGARVTHFGIGPKPTDICEGWMDVAEKMGWAHPKE